ncbi:protein LDOC1-like [Hyla sarda]|uniref:protein LDOC1-like n=1 Tax=Hyla sarda TaxID=327740 RepID=UPI0024C41B28|nr:protein LDOC1-like [Hyla sarda]
MDSAEVPDPGDLAALLTEQARQLHQLRALLLQLQSAQQQSPPQPAVASRSCFRLSLPDKYDGDSKLCRGFLTQCFLHLELMADLFPSECAKVVFIVSLLSGRALAWATPLWDRNDPATANVHSFLREFRTFLRNLPGLPLQRLLY